MNTEDRMMKTLTFLMQHTLFFLQIFKYAQEPTTVFQIHKIVFLTYSLYHSVIYWQISIHKCYGSEWQIMLEFAVHGFGVKI